LKAENHKKSSASDDLTVVLLRGNGSPRSFRLSLPALHRSLIALGFLFAFSLLAAAVMLGISIFQNVQLPDLPAASSSPSAQAPGQTPGQAPEAGGLWQQIKGTASPSPTDSELQKEVEGLRQDVARLNAQIDKRQAVNGDSKPLIQFLGPRAVLVPPSDTFIRIKNPKVTRDAAGKQMLVTFELHNVHPQQVQERGFIMVVAKTPDMILTYPARALSPDDNILVDFTKGETFAISRFREAEAAFPLNLLEGRKPSFQIILFSTDGRVLGHMHVEAGK
jgi:hypothetical protein